MNRVHYKVLQDFLNVALMGLVVGVIFSMAVTGVVFLLSGKGQAGDEQPLLSKPAEPKQISQISDADRRYRAMNTISELRAPEPAGGGAL
jgi:hypothetical protein